MNKIYQFVVSSLLLIVGFLSVSNYLKRRKIKKQEDEILELMKNNQTLKITKQVNTKVDEHLIDYYKSLQDEENENYIDDNTYTATI